VQEDRLWIADPKAINHILQKSGYLYARTGDAQERIALAAGRGIFWAEGESPIMMNTLASSLSNNSTGDAHKRHRKAMAPAFGVVDTKGFLPCFMNSANKARDLLLHSTLKFGR